MIIIFKYNLIGKQLGFGNILETILQNRGISNIKEFLNPDEKSLESEELYDNISVGYECLMKHLENDSVIVIIVDCDVDGYTSGSFLYSYLQIIKKDVKLVYIIHDDKKHGLDEITMNKLKNINCQLIILPDSSSNDYEQHKILKNRGIDILVLDHHECDKYSENAIVINNQLSNKVTNKSMTGVGVVYKFCKYIDKKLNISYADNFLDLVALGTIADVSDLRNIETRYLVSQGIKLIGEKKNNNKFISALIKSKAYDMKNEISIIGISFYISPLINSIIRNGTYNDKELMFKAFLNVEEKYIDKIRGKGEIELSIEDYVVRIAEKCKRKQKKIVDEGVENIENQINQYNLNNYGIIIANATDIIEKNYTGLIANKIANIYQKPCLLLSKYKENFAGSGRGYEKKIKDFKQWCENTGLFNFVQGHGNAFGSSISSLKMNDLYSIASNFKISEELIYEVDGIFNDKTLNATIIKSIAQYKNIWGTTVSEPLFAVEDIIIDSKDIELLGKNKNTIKFNYKGIALMKFNSNEDIYNDMKKNHGIKLTLIGRFGINEYNGNITSQIIIEDFQYTPSATKFKF